MWKKARTFCVSKLRKRCTDFANNQLYYLLTQWTARLNAMIFPRARVLLSSGIIIPVTGPAPIAKEKI